MSTETYQKQVVVGRNQDGTLKLENKTFVRASREYRQKYEAQMKAKGLRKVYVDLGNGKRGFTWESIPGYVPGSEAAKEEHE